MSLKCVRNCPFGQGDHVPAPLLGGTGRAATIPRPSWQLAAIAVLVYMFEAYEVFER